MKGRDAWRDMKFKPYPKSEMRQNHAPSVDDYVYQSTKNDSWEKRTDKDFWVTFFGWDLRSDNMFSMFLCFLSPVFPFLTLSFFGFNLFHSCYVVFFSQWLHCSPAATCNEWIAIFHWPSVISTSPAQWRFNFHQPLAFRALSVFCFISISFQPVCSSRLPLIFTPWFLIDFWCCTVWSFCFSVLILVKVHSHWPPEGWLAFRTTVTVSCEPGRNRNNMLCNAWKPSFG